MPEPTLTAKEKEVLDRVSDSFFEADDYRRVIDLLTAALSAVPRLALASPVVGELVALCREAIAKRDSSAVSSAELLRRLSALTGEEGRDG